MSHPEVRNKLWLIAVAAVILKEMGGANDSKDTLLIKYLLEIIIILHIDVSAFASNLDSAELRHVLLSFVSSEFCSLSTEIVKLKTILESQ